MNDYYFKKTKELNKDKFTELLLAAKGSRTMRDYAVACGAAPSTFTRIMQKVNKGPSSPELLQSIAENAAPESGVTVELLAEANGYSLEFPPYLTSFFQYPVSVSDNPITAIFVQELLVREASVRLSKINVSDNLLVGKNSCATYDLQIITDAFCGEPQSWLMVFLSPHRFSLNDHHTCYMVRENLYKFIGKFVLFSFTKAYDVFSPPPRFSIVVSNRDIYGYIIDEISDTIVSVDISIILLDTKNSVIADEYMLPHVTYGHRPGYFMTTEPVINHQSSELYEDDFERRGDNEGNP